MLQIRLLVPYAVRRWAITGDIKMVADEIGHASVVMTEKYAQCYLWLESYILTFINVKCNFNYYLTIALRHITLKFFDMLKLD